jgi:hypothetical protein
VERDLPPERDAAAVGTPTAMIGFDSALRAIGIF